jgi:lipoyl(octanoyl) transferase
MVNAELMRDSLAAKLLPKADAPPVEWVIAPGLTPYPDAVAEMERLAAAIAAGESHERIWLVEHPPLYTSGTSAKAADLLDTRFPVFETGRGGQFTYHGPGQRVAYVMLDLERRTKDVRRFVAALEAWIILTEQGEGHRWLDGRGQDCRHRHPRAALGDVSRDIAERGA